MNMIDKALGVHPQSLDLRSRRMEVLSQNIANADTPHYKARDVDFRSVLSESRTTTLRATHPKHLAVAELEGGNGVMFRNPFNVAFDGNTVELNVEHAQYGKAAADYQATLSFLESRISGMRKALKGE